MAKRDDRERERLGQEIAGLMGPFVRGMHTHFRACADDLGLAPGEAQALWVLDLRGPVGTKELARALEIDPANASTMLTKLEGRGLVRRAAAESDRRRRLTSLTDQGRETRAALAHCIGERRPAFRDFSTEELRTFRDLLGRAAGAD